MNFILKKEKIVNNLTESTNNFEMKVNTKCGYKKILYGELLIWQKPGVFDWQKPKGTVYGTITMSQDKSPCIYVSISQQINKKIVYSYSSCERKACCVDIYWKKGNECWHTELRDDIIIKSKKIQNIPDLGIGYSNVVYKVSNKF